MAFKAEAVSLLGAAVSQRQQGNLGIALELGRQASGKWPQYADAKSFLTEVAPQATAQAQAAATAQVQANAAATAQAVAQATAAVRSEATDLLGAAASKREEGQLGLALELGRQALGKWSEYPEAKRFVAEVAPQATAAARDAQAQATTAAREVQAQGTAQACSAATERAQTAAAERARAATAAEQARLAASIGRVGQRMESAGIALTVNGASRTASLDQFSRAAQGKTYLVLDVTVENVTRDNAPYNPLYFKVKDAEGFEYNSTLSIADRALKSGELAKGERARGTLAFEVPATVKGLVASYQPLVIFGGYQTIRVNVE